MLASMPCILAVLVLLFPRVAIVVLWLFTNFFTGIFDTVLIPFLGFIFMPLTLVAYTWLTRIHEPVDALYLVVMLLAIVFDLGLIGGGEWSRRRR
jgi:hypothetical protein